MRFGFKRVRVEIESLLMNELVFAFIIVKCAKRVFARICELDGAFFYFF